MRRHKRVLLAVDMREVIEEHIRRKSLYSFYTRFSLHDLIQSVLSVDPFIDYSQMVYDELERRFGDDDLGIDMDLFTIFYEMLITDIDSAVKEQYQIEFEDIGQSSYIFEQWIDKTSLLIRLER